MRTLKFRPLRRVKSMNKVVVASYTQWRSVKTADYNQFNLVIDDEYKALPKDEFVHNHKGELLYFFPFNPANVPVFSTSVMSLEEMRENNRYYGIRFGDGQSITYRMDGADCGGVPTFTHWTADYVAEFWKRVDEVEPLTVGTVRMWFGWFLYQLNNSYLNKK